MVYITKIVGYGFEEAIQKVTAALKQEGFGIITEIDVQKTLKEKIDADFRRYRILGACNPGFAYRALQLEDKIGLLMPCNVIVQEHPHGKTEITTFNPFKSMPILNNPEIEKLANEIECKLTDVIKNV
jgi:uncharacterized protein (DUF302 family)